MVVAAIRYMETAANIVIKDLNCSRIKMLEEENKYPKAKIKGNRFARGWFNICEAHALLFSPVS